MAICNDKGDYRYTCIMETENPEGRKILLGASKFDVYHQALHPNFRSNATSIFKSEEGTGIADANLRSGQFEDEIDGCE